MNSSYQKSITSLFIYFMKPEESKWSSSQKNNQPFCVLPDKKGFAKSLFWIGISIIGAIFIGNLN